tara:strand:+ start:584 stop:853 length:270 start_codon:yes stop_codon:yes gene_type:complete
VKLPEVNKACTDAVTGRAERNIHYYGAEFMIRLLAEDRKGLVHMICKTADMVFPEDLTNQAKAATVAVLVLSAINATMEGQDLEDQFGE